MYALARAAAAEVVPPVRGVGEAPVRAIVEGGLACFVSTVAMHEFGADALRENLEDLAWLERTARRHDAVVQACADVTTIAPFRLATICTDDQSVCERLRSLSGRAAAVLARLDGRHEFGVKLFATEPHSAPTDPEPVESSGRAYLMRRRDERASQERFAEQAMREADAVHQALSERAVMAYRHRPQDQRLTGDPRPMVLNAAFLIDDDKVERFRAAADGLAAQRSPDSLVVTGPWPPYSFATVEET
jgi:hypothetical protein